MPALPHIFFSNMRGTAVNCKSSRREHAHCPMTSRTARGIRHLVKADACLWQIPAIQPVGATLLPFLIVGWKGGGNEGHAQATLQAVLGAACLVTSTYAFFEHAAQPCILYTMQFTITCDMQTVTLRLLARQYRSRSSSFLQDGHSPQAAR
jgi:hypothetical protein